MSRSEQLEREAEQRRGHIADTLAELRNRMTPGEVVDQLVDYVRDGSGGQFARNLQRQVVDNPLPLTLVGAGIAWLMMGARSNGARRADWAEADAPAERLGAAVRDRASEASEAGRATGTPFGDATRETARSWSDDAREGVEATVDDVRNGAGRLGAATQSAAEHARDFASSAYESGAQTAGRAADGVRRSTTTLRDNAALAGQSLMGTLKEQPLVLAGIGLAIGAAIAAALPATDAENRAIGEASDDVKERVTEFAGEQAEKAEAVGERAAEAAGDAARHQGHEASETTEGPALVPSREADAEARSEFDLSANDRDRR